MYIDIQLACNDIYQTLDDTYAVYSTQMQGCREVQLLVCIPEDSKDVISIDILKLVGDITTTLMDNDTILLVDIP